MDSAPIAKGILKAVGVLALIVLLLYSLYAVRTLIGFIAISAVLALIGRPLVVFLRRKLRLPNVIAVTVFLSLALTVLIGIIALILPVLQEHGDNILLLDTGDIQSKINKIYAQVSDAFGTSPKEVKLIIDRAKIDEKVIDGLDMVLLLESVVSFLASISVGLFTILFISFFFLKDSKILQRLILTLVPRDHEAKTLNSLVKIKHLLPRYFIGLLGQLTILFTIYSATLLVADVDNAIIIAFFCALFNIIPYLGPIIGGVIMIVMAVLDLLESGPETQFVPLFGIIGAGIIIGQLVDNFFSQPYIFSSSVKSHPLEIFLVIIIAGLLFGVVGMIAAVPGYTVLKVILVEFFSDNRIVKHLSRDLEN